MFRRSRLILAVTALSVSTFALAAQAAFSKSGGADVKFQAAAPGLGIPGTCTKLTAKEVDGKLTLAIDMKSCSVPIEKRDKHMHSELETGKYEGEAKFPTATLSIDRKNIKLPEDGKGFSDGEVKGALTLHGVTKPLKIKYSAKRSGSDYEIKNATFTFKYTDFGVKDICFVICVKKDVTVTIPSLKLSDK